MEAVFQAEKYSDFSVELQPNSTIFRPGVLLPEVEVLVLGKYHKYGHKIDHIQYTV
jgi:hypothetical protein